MRHLIKIGYYDAVRCEDTLANLLQHMDEDDLASMDLEQLRQMLQLMMQYEQEGCPETIIKLDSQEIGYSTIGLTENIPLPDDLKQNSAALGFWHMIERKLTAFPDIERFYIPVNPLDEDTADRICGIYVEKGWDVTYVEAGAFAVFVREQDEDENDE